MSWDGSAWSSWGTLGGVLASSPTACSMTSGTIDVFAKGNDNALWHMAWDGSSWSGWESLGGYIVGSPSCMRRSGSAMSVYAKSQDGSMVHKYWNGSSSTWRDWENVGGAAPKK